MLMPTWGKVSFKTKTVINSLGDGINTFVPPIDIAESEWSYGRNCSGRNYPALSVRAGRKHTFSQISSPYILGQRNNQYPHIQDGTTWKRWDGSTWQTVQTGLAAGTGKFVDFKTGTSLFTILANGTDKYSWDGSTVTNLTNMPSSKLITVFKGRVYILNGKTLYFSALNKINDWTTINDAGQIDITRAKGDGTAICTFGNHVVVFTEFSMHELYGTSPSSYTLTDVDGAKGCISDNSIVELNGVLYWMYSDGIYAYTGGQPVKISDYVNGYINLMNLAQKSKIVGWGNNYSVFWSIPYNGSNDNNITIEFNTKLKKWYIHDYAIIDSTIIADKAYGLDSSGWIWDMENGEDDNGTPISWEIIGKVCNDGAISQKKVVSNLWITLDLPVRSSLSVYTSNSFDNDDFKLLKVFNSNPNEQNVRAILPITMLQNIDFYRIKFVGKGQCKIHFLEKDIRIKAR